MRRDLHLDDAALIAGYYDPSAFDGLPDRHLRACARCTARQREIAAALDDDEPAWRDREASALSPGRLEAQRRAILDRLPAHPGFHARVIPFAPRVVRSALAPARARHWRLAAAAAILAMVGAAGAGWVVETGRHDRLRTAAADDQGVVEPVWRPDAAQSQEALLSEIEMALASPGTPELRALDALTPQGPDSPGRR